MVEIEFPKYPSKAIDTALGRAYVSLSDSGECISNIYAYSATTLIGCLDKGPGFLKFYSQGWDKAKQYSMERAYIGTVVHALIERLLLGEKIDLSKPIPVPDEYKGISLKISKDMPFEVDMRLRAFLEWWYSLDAPQIIALELMLFDPSWTMWAGTCDLVYRDGSGKVSMVDFKTGKHYPKQHALQQSMYKQLFQQLYDIEVDEISCLYLTDKGKYKLEPLTYEPEIAQMTYHLFNYLNSSAKTQKMPNIKLPDEGASRVFQIKKGEKDE